MTNTRIGIPAGATEWMLAETYGEISKATLGRILVGICKRNSQKAPTATTSINLED